MFFHSDVVKNTTILPKSSLIAYKKVELLYNIQHPQLSETKLSKLLHVVKLASSLIPLQMNKQVNKIINKIKILH